MLHPESDQEVRLASLSPRLGCSKITVPKCPGCCRSMAGTSLGLQVPEDESEKKARERDKEAGSVSCLCLDHGCSLVYTWYAL